MTMLHGVLFAIISQFLDFITGLSLTTIGVIITVVVIGSIASWYGVISKLRRSKAERFQRLISQYDEIDVLLHPNPDPDSMAAALGVHKIAELQNVDTNLIHPGKIRHQENQAFKNILQLPLTEIESVREMNNKDAVVIVDHNKPRGFTGATHIEPIAIIDHHNDTGSDAQHKDVRSDYGSSATIIVEYLRDIGIPFSKENTTNGQVYLSTEEASGLLYGIQSDTNNLTRGCSKEDFRAVEYLYPFTDENVLTRMADPVIPREVLETKFKAVNNIEQRGSYGVCDLGEVTNVDGISQAADELIRIEGITAIVVFGEYNGHIRISSRSKDDRIDVSSCLEKAVDDIPMAETGGHTRMAGGQIPVEQLNGTDSSNNITKNEFIDIVFKTMNGER